MSEVRDAAAWADVVRALGERRGVRYEPVGGPAPGVEPAALCPGGTNRLTGELDHEFWGASCDADERERGGLFRGGQVLPGAVLAKAHMPDLAAVRPVFNVESKEGAGDAVESRVSRRRVEFESIDFNKRFIATVPRDHDPIALRELFSPAFIDWITRIPAEIDFGITDKQLFFHWRLRALTGDELGEALHSAGGVFQRLHREMEENDLATFKAGPWNAGLEEFPATLS